MSTDDTETVKRRGRPPKPEQDRKSTNLKFRTRAGIRERLEAEAEKKNRSVSEEVEWRIEKSFDYESIDEAVNEAFMRYMRIFFGGENNAVAMAVLAAFWQRSIETANKQIINDDHWSSNELKQKIMIEVMRRGSAVAVRDAAHAEQHRMARLEMASTSHALGAWKIEGDDNG